MKKVIPFLIITLAPHIFIMGTCNIDTEHIATLSASIDGFEATFNLNSQRWLSKVDSLSDEWANLTQEEAEKLIRESDEYQEILKEFNLTAQQFVDEIHALREDLPIHVHWAIADIERVLQKTLGAMTSNVLCIGSVIEVMLIRTLDEIQAKLPFGSSSGGGPVVEHFPTPGICHTSLSSIDLQLPSFLRRELVYYGYDFVDEVIGEIYVVLHRPGFELDLTTRLSKNGDNQLVVNLASPLIQSGNDLEFEAVLAQYTSLKLFYNQEFLSEVPIFN